MQLFVTVLDESSEAAANAVRALSLDHDGVEVRAERFADAVDLALLRAATAKPLILTYRGMVTTRAEVEAAIGAGIDFIDVEYREPLDREMLARFADRIVVSHHDYDDVAEVERIMDGMRAFGCARTKLAATPRNFADNLRLLALLDGATGRPGDAVIGMSERGLYSRILAPFRGSALTFVSAGAPAAPGQLSLARALEIFGPRRETLHARHVFAVVGNPAGHSLSPSIHNRLFREKHADAAYTIASVERFEEVVEPFRRGEPRGLSITAPFKEEAFAFATAANAEIGANARRCGSANTLVNFGTSILADNTDVDGFRALLQQVCGRDRKTVAIVGAGGTARAALAAVDDEKMPVMIFNRTPGKLGARPLSELAAFDGEVVVDTRPGDEATASFPLRPGMTYIRAAYGAPSAIEENARAAGVQVITGLELLEAQAQRQHELFMKAIDARL